MTDETQSNTLVS